METATWSEATKPIRYSSPGENLIYVTSCQGTVTRCPGRLPMPCRLTSVSLAELSEPSATGPLKYYAVRRKSFKSATDYNDIFTYEVQVGLISDLCEQASRRRLVLQTLCSAGCRDRTLLLYPSPTQTSCAPARPQSIEGDLVASEHGSRSTHHRGTGILVSWSNPVPERFA